MGMLAELLDVGVGPGAPDMEQARDRLNTILP